MSLPELMDLAVKSGASDLHLKAGSPPALRVDGELLPLAGTAPLAAGDVALMLQEISSAEQRQTFEETRELDFSTALDGGERFRVNACFQQGTTALVLRSIPARVPQLSALGLPEVCKDLANRPRGMVLVTGATGSGKSTTLAAMIDHINRNRSCHIVTLEDPIEFIHRDQRATVTQREIGSDTRSFADGLRHVLRQDPDVILIGELRDLETIAAAITAAETGHLVFGTLHTNTAAQTVDRIIDVFPPGQQPQIRAQLSVVLQGVISMVLLPSASGKGRVACLETLVITAPIRNLIREAKTFQIPNAMQIAAQNGTQTMDQALKALVERRLVNPEAALSYATDPEEFRKQMRVLSGAR